MTAEQTAERFLARYHRRRSIEAAQAQRLERSRKRERMRYVRWWAAAIDAMQLQERGGAAAESRP